MGNRVLGVDVSDWQQEDLAGNPLQSINWPLVHTPIAQGGGGKSFAFIRSSRGGTTGTYNKYTREGTLSHRYDDYRFHENIDNATAAGVLSGPYHFARPDIVTNWPVAGQIANDPIDEANHFIQQAGAYMRPGYLLPVLDLEAGQPQAGGTPGRTGAQLTQFAVAFANRIKEVKGVAPLVYINQNYANYIDSTVPTAIPNLWIARWPNQADPGSIDVQNIHPPPSPSTANVYGKWNPNHTVANPYPDGHPWEFWQYASTGKNIPGLLGDRNGNTDLNVAQGDIEFVKDYSVPALWMTNNSGQWTTISNWNTDADPSGHGGPARLPGTNDNVVLERTSANVTITLTSGAQSIRKLTTFERLDINGGSLSVARGVQLNSTVNLNVGTLSGDGVTVGIGGLVNINAGTLVSNALNVVGGQVNFTSGPPKTLRTKSVTVSSGKIDLGSHKMIVDYAGGSLIGSWGGSSYSGVTGLIASGRNDLAWNGNGIVTSQSNALSGLTTLGIAEASKVLGISGAQTASWKGQSVDSSSVLVLYTYAGDANLDGLIDGTDYFYIDSKVSTPGAGGYDNGDFNYDGSIDGTDYFYIDSNISLQGAPLGASAEVVGIPAGLTAIPEPLGVSWVVTIALLASRRRHV